MIEEVIKTVRTDFINMGVDEQVLADLQSVNIPSIWLIASDLVAVGTKAD